jgi:DNA repair protein RadD
MQLRPYQTQLVTEIRGQYQLGHRSVLAVLPTGGGKTVCFSYIAQAASVKGNRVLILVHRAELLDQASRAMPVPHGIIAANRSHGPKPYGAGSQRANRSPEATPAATGFLPASGG